MPLLKRPTSKKLIPFRFHVFVCQNERNSSDPRGCCKSKGSETILSAMKDEAEKLGLRHEGRIQKSGCLDACEYGPSAVVYPEGVWYGDLTEEGAREIVREHLNGQNVVDRLIIPGK